MKIRTQSIILVAGIILMPLIVVSLFVFAEGATIEAREATRFESGDPQAGSPDLPPPPRRKRPPDSILGEGPGDAPETRGLELRESGEREPPDPESMIFRLFAAKPGKMGMAVADQKGTIVRSDIPGMPVGSSFSSVLASAARHLAKDKVLALGIAPKLPPGYVAAVYLPRSEFFPAWLRNDLIKVAVFILAGILAFAAAMCVAIVRSITKSVLSLEAATKRVAAGNLEVPIAVEGSNEIASLSRSLDRLRIEIMEDQARRGRFIMGISHDLKTPLALVKGYSEALEEELEGASPSASDHLRIIQSKADQLEGMIDDLIDFERLDTGEWRRDRMAPADLGSFLKSFAKRVEADATLLGRELRSSIDLPAPSMVRMDERLATRAIENLVNNALRYTAPGDVISLEASALGPTYYVIVADEGPGISPEELPRVFEPFYRGSSSRREQGMGLGLAIVKAIVDSHGWSIEARSDSASLGHKGAVFVIGIPR